MKERVGGREGLREGRIDRGIWGARERERE